MSEYSAFEIGDSVRLKSGGPLLSVVAIKGGSATVTWFTKAGRPHTKVYPAEALIKYDPPLASGHFSKSGNHPFPQKRRI
jgi:uncharacterized protein YodC (DUF2158 family)